jgi:MFS family permease
LAGSTFLSVSGDAISDVFPNSKVRTWVTPSTSLPAVAGFTWVAADVLHSPMLIWSAAPFIRPVLGPLVSGFIDEQTDWRWKYFVVIIWAAAMLALLIAFVPETFNRELPGEERWIAPMEKLNRTFLEAVKKSIKLSFS